MGNRKTNSLITKEDKRCFRVLAALLSVLMLTVYVAMQFKPPCSSNYELVRNEQTGKSYCVPHDN